MRPRTRFAILLGAVALAASIVLLFAEEAYAYAGPGAGFAIVTSFLVVFAAMALAAIYLVAWPVRSVWRLLRGRRAFARARVRRVVILGLDGLDAGLAERFSAEGKLPNLSRLSYRRLQTTNPSISPVAWSTFQTGMDPSYHGIFDFLRPARPSYAAEMSSVRIAAPPRSIRVGKYSFALGRPRVRLRRHGVPFWKILGDHGIFSAVLRVPITFPPERFRGVSLSAMSVPDLRGTQGTFSLYTSTTRQGAGEESKGGEGEGGVRVPVRLDGNRLEARLVGPPNPIVVGNPSLSVPFRLVLDGDGRGGTLRIQGQKVRLQRGKHTDWIRVSFRAGFGVRIRGIVRFCLVEVGPTFRLYASPVSFDPERPALPISHPRAYSAYLSKRMGPYATLGLAEDTWALNERALDEEEFLEGTYRIHEERERMFFDALDQVRKGLVVCVFDASDRVQHMFMRTLCDGHPANAGKDPRRHGDVMEDLYRRMDDLVGRTAQRLRKGDLLLVLSDHGFNVFRRGVNLNAWLREEGFLVMENGLPDEGGLVPREGTPPGADAARAKASDAGHGAWFAGVDWTRTRAYALGLTGIYLNLKGRESKGIVEANDAPALKEAILSRLESLRDPSAPGATPVNRVFDSATIYRGPYRDEAPDLLVGYGAGYRVSWSGATGGVGGGVFEDNTKAWSGDHCMDPSIVPGVLYSTMPLGDPGPASDDGASLADIAPTVLDLFGIEPPDSMKGRRLLRTPQEAS
jgi:predicted AlkP superfamily phosphohydrolase/phosphomutase